MNTAKASTPASTAAPLTVIHVPFHGDSLDAVHDGGRVWVPVRRVSEALGLDFSAQLKRLNRHAWATVAMMTTVAEDGKSRSVACLDLDSLPMWLATIDVKRVSPDARAKLVVYQRECAKVLREHFFGTREAAPRKTEGDRLREAAFAVPRPGRFLPDADELTEEQMAHFFGPQLGAKERNHGRNLRLALGLDEDSRFDDGTQLMKMLWVDLEMLERVASMHSTDMQRAEEERDIDDEKETAEFLASALWSLRNRTRGTSSLMGLLADAKRCAEDAHREGRDTKKKYADLDSIGQRARDSVALANLRAREGLAPNELSPEDRAYLDHCVRVAKEHDAKTGKLDLLAEFDRLVAKVG